MTVKMILSAMLIVLSMAAPVAADNEMIQEQLTASGAGELEDYLPHEAEEIMDRLGVELSTDGIGEISVGEVTGEILDIASDASEGPVRACLAALAIIVLCAAAGTVAEGKEHRPSPAMDTVSSAAVILTVCVPAAGLVDSTADAISASCGFASVLVPVLSSLTAVSGRASSAAAYSAFTLTAIEGITVITSAVVIPVLRVLFGICAVSALCESVDLSRLAGSVERNCKWLLGLVAMLLSGVLGISTVAASAADGAGLKAGRFIISGAVPVVGGVISEAIGTVMNCLSIVRTSVGAFGIAAAMATVLPGVVLAVIWKLCLNCTAGAAEALGAKRPAAALRSLASVITLVLGVTAFTAMLIICSTAIVMSMRSV